MAVHEVTIARPIEDVFAVLTDVTLTGRWYPVDVEEWWVTPPPHGIGSVRRARVKMLGRAMENDAEVTAYEPPRLAALRGSGNAPFDVTLRFTPAGNGTHVRVETEFHLRGPMRLIGPLFMGRYERSWEEGLEAARRMMEAGELNPAGPAADAPSA